MTDREEALRGMPDGCDINDIGDWAFKYRNIIRKALQAKEPIDALQAENARLRALTGQLEQSETKLIIERDTAQDYADKLAEKISSMTGYSIGEHSSANCPWDNALELELPQIEEK